MKRQYFFLLIFIALILPGTAYTQDEITAIDSLAIELWPDYDRASVLVLLTGALPADTTLPAAVTLPFPETADLNAVARIDKRDGKMKDDIFSVLGPGDITFVLPDLRFRLEYYFPYTADNNQRTFDFNWVADLSVNELQLRIQRPVFAGSLSTVPRTENVFRAPDGFTYYTLPTQSVPAGQSFSVHVEYTMTASKLSIESLAPSKTRVQEPGSPPTSKGDAGIEWPIIAAVVCGVFLVILFIWLTATRRAPANRRETLRAKARIESSAKFCHHCGKPTGKDDRFCSKCGSALKDK